MSNPRNNRLRHDYERMLELKTKSPFIDFELEPPIVSPPERYLVKFSVKGISGIDAAGNPIYSTAHQVKIYLHANYPREEPQMHWVTPIWQPNIDHETGDVCINEWAASRTLDDLCEMLCGMVAYQIFLDEDIPPYPKDPYVAAWSLQHRHLFPVYSGPIIGPDLGANIKLEEDKGPEFEITLLGSEDTSDNIDIIKDIKLLDE